MLLVGSLQSGVWVSCFLLWIEPIIARRGFNKAVVALANKNARIGWLIIARDAHYDPGKAFG